MDRDFRHVPWKVGVFGNFLWDRKGIPRRKDTTFHTKTGNISGQALNLGIKASLIMRELKLRAGNGYDKVKNWFVEIGSKANVEVSHV